MIPTTKQLLDARQQLEIRHELKWVYYVSRDTYVEMLKSEDCPISGAPADQHWMHGIFGLKIKPHPTLRGVDYESSVHVHYAMAIFGEHR